MKRTLLATASCLLYSTLFLPGQGGDLDPSNGNGALSGGVPQRSMKAISQVDPGTPLPTLDGGALSTFPLTITEPGSYYLTQNVTLDPTGGAAITIKAEGVTLDLRGYQLRAVGGPATTVSESAIYIDSGSDGAVVRNGTIVGPWYHGIYSAINRHHRLEDITIWNVEDSGIDIFPGVSQVARCRFFDCGNDGIDLGQGSTISDCLAYFNDGRGFNLAANCVAANCLAQGNMSNGFYASVAGSLTRCTSTSNGAGIYCGIGSALADCVAESNSGIGISVSDACALSNCTSVTNSSDGFDVIGPSSLTNCTARDNTGNGFSVLAGGAVFLSCIASSNDKNGFDLNYGNHLTGCVAIDNTEDGYELDESNTIFRSISHENQDYGIAGSIFSKGNHIDGNSVIDNTLGGIFLTSGGTPNVVTRNLLRGNGGAAITPAPVTGGQIAPIQDVFDATHPFANFSF